jgi:hypothetical protein
MDLDRQFCEWRDHLPPHLSFHQSRNNDNEPLWITRARAAIHIHFNHVYIVMHRPLLTAPRFSTPFLSSEASNEMGISAAKENISLIHSKLKYDPPLRKWMYYCYYNFMAELAVLTMLIQQPLAEEAREWAAFANMATESFEWMLPLDAAAKCRTMSKAFVDDWQSKVEGAKVNGNHPDRTKRRRSNNQESSQRVRSQDPQPNTPSSQLNFPIQQSSATFSQPFMSTEFQAPILISPRGSDASYSPLNPMRYDVQPSMPYSTTQTLDAAAAETLQSFSGAGWPNQGIFVGDGAMGWTYNFDDLFGDLSRNNMGGHGGI